MWDPIRRREASGHRTDRVTGVPDKEPGKRQALTRLIPPGRIITGAGCHRHKCSPARKFQGCDGKRRATCRRNGPIVLFGGFGRDRLPPAVSGPALRTAKTPDKKRSHARGIPKAAPDHELAGHCGHFVCDAAAEHPSSPCSVPTRPSLDGSRSAGAIRAGRSGRWRSRRTLATALTPQAILGSVPPRSGVVPHLMPHPRSPRGLAPMREADAEAMHNGGSRRPARTRSR